MSGIARWLGPHYAENAGLDFASLTRFSCISVEYPFWAGPMGGCGSAAGLFAAAYWLCSVVSAGAQGAGASLLLFSGTDLWAHGRFLYGGALWSPGGLDREGFTLKAVLSGGTYSYLSGNLGEVQGRELVAQILPGWRFKLGNIELKVFTGLD